MYDQVFLSDIADTNPEVLGASTESDRELIYLDLGCVQSGWVNWHETQSLLFRHAPSRARRKVLAGDVLFGTVRPSLQSHGHIGEAATGNLVASTGFTVIRAIKGLSHDRYLFHAILSNEVLKQSVNVSVGSNYPAVTERDVRHFRIRFPSLPEQQKIAQILDTLDTQIQRTEALIAKLEKIKEGLIRDLLTRGIDQNGQLRPTPEQAPELYKESVLGLIPREWDVSELGTVTTSSVIGPFGSDLVASDYRSEGVPVVFVRDIAGARYDRVSRVCVSHKKALALSAHEVKTGDLLLTKMGLPPCISAVYPENEPAGVITADIVRLRLNASVIPKWAQHFVNSEYVKAQVRGITAGVTRPKVTLKDVRSLKIAIPSTEEQARILDILQRCSKRMSSERAELSKLQAQKSGLMDDLLTGRVRVTPLLKDAG